MHEKLRITAATLASGVLAFSCNVSAAVPIQLMVDGHLTAPTLVDGRSPFLFILDTGADNTVIYERFAKQQKLKRDGAGNLRGQTGLPRQWLIHCAGRAMEDQVTVAEHAVLALAAEILDRIGRGGASTMPRRPWSDRRPTTN